MRLRFTNGAITWGNFLVVQMLFQGIGFEKLIAGFSLTTPEGGWDLGCCWPDRLPGRIVNRLKPRGRMFRKKFFQLTSFEAYRLAKILEKEITRSRNLKMGKPIVMYVPLRDFASLPTESWTALSDGGIMRVSYTRRQSQLETAEFYGVNSHTAGLRKAA